MAVVHIYDGSALMIISLKLDLYDIKNLQIKTKDKNLVSIQYTLLVFDSSRLSHADCGN